MSARCLISLDFNESLLTSEEREELSQVSRISPQDVAEWKTEKGIEQAVRRNEEYFDNLIISTYGIDRMTAPKDSWPFDCRRLTLLGKGLDLKYGRGDDEDFQAYARSSPKFRRFIVMVAKCIIENNLTSVSFYCNQGQHRSVAAATLFRDRFAKNARIRHLCLKR